MTEQTSIRELKGIGEKTEKLFHKIGVVTVGDLIRYYPGNYDIYEEPAAIADLEEGRVQTVCGSLYGQIQVGGSPRMQVTTAFVKDGTGTLRVIWFRMPFLRNTLAKGGKIILRGRVSGKKNGLAMEHPEIFYPMGKYEEKLHTMQPMYALTAGLTNNVVRKAMKQALDGLTPAIETFPKELRLRFHLAEYNFALRGIHFPENKEVFFQARKRLVFEEFLFFILNLRRLKFGNGRLKNEYPIDPKTEVDALIQKLPFSFTHAQQRVWREIRENLRAETAMSRLVQGDVGSGKTIVAFFALIETALNGFQGAMMAPTEVLARQHYESVSALLETYHLPVKAALLTGSMNAKEKRKACDRVECGLAKIVIGTHALIQDAVRFDNLALVITDEQHRFGVKQRENFAKKGGAPHVLVMSATPIPRTLAMILYGDLDISVIDELPSNRLPVKNCVVDTSYRAAAYQFMHRQIAEGRQCYVICPMAEESGTMEAENVIDYAKALQEEMGPDVVVDFLHGKMKPTLKDQIMERFVGRESHILVSTTVVEVGIDVPNATVMLIENAERFGLAQLHQLRGRVGRGQYQSYCIFMTGSKTKEAKKRLEILKQTNDGFRIADEDLKLRGPGDLFGIRQSGLMDFRIGDVYQDAGVLSQANEAADWLIKEHPGFLQKMTKNEEPSSVIL